ncbi:hypothetical protein J2Y61_004176 [Asticcacaulis sp. BE141]|nr:hypothetical protein [Asticcacaulis sp. BE141]
MKIKDAEFREKHLELGDVWVWSSDFHESEDSLVPIPLTEEALANADSLLIRSRFLTALGNQLQGFIVYTMGTEDVFAIEVLKGDQRFTFNKFASVYSRAELERLASFLEENVEHLLPIKYNIVPKELNISPGLFSF